MRALLRRLLVRGDDGDGSGRADLGPTTPTWPVPNGRPRSVSRVVVAADGGDGRRFLPTEDVTAVGPLLEVLVQGPVRLRPGEAAEPVEQAAHRIGELVVLRAGALEHRDSLGHRGRLDAPAARVLSAGAGVLTEVGLHRDVRRDGGDVEVLVVRWVQDRTVTPTVRMVDDLIPHAQGRSTITPLLGEEAGLRSADGVRVLHVRTSPGAGAALAVGEDHVVVLAVLDGEVLVGEALTAVGTGRLAVLAADGPVVSIATHLEGQSGATVLVIALPATVSGGEPPDVPVIRRGMVIAEDDDDLQRIQEAVAAGAFGRLPTS